MYRTFLRTLLPLLLVLALAACAPPPTQPPAAEQPAEAAEEAEPTPVPTATPIVAEYGTGALQLSFWNGLTGADGVTMQAMVEQFTAENPDISVRIEAMAWATYWDKLLTSMVSGSPPDVFILHEFLTASYARQGVLRPSGDLYVSGGGTLPDEDFKPQLLERLDYEGVRYGVPLDNLGWGVWINRDLFEAAGLDPDTPPTSGAELIEMARKLTLDANGKHPDEEGFDATKVTQWGFIVNNPTNTFQSVLWQYGGDIFKDSDSLLDDEAALAALQFLTDLIYVEHVSPPPSGFSAEQAFVAGQLAIMPYGTWGLNLMLGSDINWDVWPMIQIGPVQPAARMSSHVLHLPATAEGEKLEAGKRLITYLSDHSDIWATSGQVPARFSIQEGLDPEELRAVLVFADSFNRQGRIETPHPLKQELNSAWQPEVNGAWDNVASPEEALNTASERVQDILDRGAE